MSLSGSVEDLPLLEILQVVSFCQKTGHLTVRAPDGEAGVVFDSGRVVSGYAWDVPPLPPLDPPQGAARESVVRERIASILERLVRLRDGDFAFNLTQDVPVTLAGRNLSDEMLPYGINPEEMVLDLAKKLDEDRRDAAAALEASFVTLPLAPDSAPTAAAPAIELDAAPSPAEADSDLRLEELLDEEEPPLEELPVEDELLLEEEPELEKPTQPAATASGPTVLLVDDEPEVLRVVVERLAAAGFVVAQASDLREARAEMAKLAARKQPFFLVADVGLPSEAGSSFRGGIDVARYASGLKPPPPVLLMSETIDEKLLARAKRAGASLLAFKPGLSKLDPLQYEADLRAFGDKLTRDLLPRLEGRRDTRLTRDRSAPPSDAGSAAREALVRAAIADLGEQPDPDMVAFLLLRTARAFFPRVVLLLVRDERLKGLAGFGPVANGSSLDLVARELSVPLTPPSPFSEAVAFGKVWSGPLPADGPLGALVAQLGALGAAEGAVLPVRSQHETLTVVYGDMPGGGRIPDLAPLVSFIEAAGRALDSTLLARRSPTPLAC
ncbi:MAG: response regulator [Burkholderiales bacterium]